MLRFPSHKDKCFIFILLLNKFILFSISSLRSTPLNQAIMDGTDGSDFKGDDRKAIPAIGYIPPKAISTGTTLIAVEYDGGVVVGTDSRTSAG